MNSEKIRCPKCQHEQDNQVECEACGLIFARYSSFQQKQEERRQAAENAQQHKKGISLLHVALLVLLTASATWYFTRTPNPAPQVATSDAGPITAPPQTDAPPARQETRPSTPPAMTEQPVVSHGGGIEHARLATVSVETPWGTGSGFFVKENAIVTNRHVVEIDPTELENARKKMETGRRMIELEKQKIKEMKLKMQEIPQGPTRKQLAIIIQQHEEELAKNLPQFEQAEEKLQNMAQKTRASDIKIFLADGSEHRAGSVSISQSHDLALLSLYEGDQTVIKRPPSNTFLQQGEKVYTVGSPVGLRNTVTSGVFSGYRKRETDGALLLQTDAPINPGNSGGPLIDEKGYVRGVNTMILRDTEGIGFAIPIETVFEEFSSALY